MWTVVSSIKLHVPPCRSCLGWMAAINSSHKASACSISKQGWGWGVDSWCVNKVACVDPVWGGCSFKFASTQYFEEPTTAYRTSNSANRVGVDSWHLNKLHATVLTLSGANGCDEMLTHGNLRGHPLLIGPTTSARGGGGGVHKASFFIL